MSTRRIVLIMSCALVACDPSVESTEVSAPSSPKADEVDGESERSGGLDVCDVSWLYPMPTSEQELDLLPRLDFTVGNTVAMSQEALNEVLDSMSSARPEGPGIELAGDGSMSIEATRDIANWRIVAARFDPLAPDFSVDPLDPGHATQIRLVAQPFGLDSGGRPFVQDVALHLVFEVAGERDPAKTELDRMMADGLSTLAQSSPASTVGVPLGVHPGLAADFRPTLPGAPPSFIDRATRFLAEQLSRAHLEHVAMMGLRSGGDVWIFAAVSQGDDGSFTPNPMPLVDGSSFIEFNLDQQDLRETPYDPVPSRGIALVDLFSPFGSERFDEALPLLHTVDNPNVAHIGNVDCVSCHVSTQRLYITAQTDILDRIVDLFGVAPPIEERFTVPQGLTGFVRERDSQREVWHVGNFRYFNGTPSVSVRTANESALVADFYNNEVLVDDAGDALGNPLGLRCDESRVALCFLSGGADERCLGPDFCEAP